MPKKGNRQTALGSKKGPPVERRVGKKKLARRAKKEETGPLAQE